MDFMGFFTTGHKVDIQIMFMDKHFVTNHVANVKGDFMLNYTFEQERKEMEREYSSM